MKEYIVHLIGEMSNFVLGSAPSRMVISLHQEAGGLHLSVMDNSPRTEEELNSIIESLTAEKRPELAEYYGSMAGHDLLGTARLNLIGWHVKHAAVNRTEGGTKIDIWMGNEHFDPRYFDIPAGK